MARTRNVPTWSSARHRHSVVTPVEIAFPERAFATATVTVPMARTKRDAKTDEVSINTMPVLYYHNVSDF